jgi:hypothetical protein
MTMLSGEDGLEPPCMFQVGGVPISAGNDWLAAAYRDFCTLSNLPAGPEEVVRLENCINLEMINGVVRLFMLCRVILKCQDCQDCLCLYLIKSPFSTLSAPASPFSLGGPESSSFSLVTIWCLIREQLISIDFSRNIPVVKVSAGRTCMFPCQLDRSIWSSRRPF